MNEGTPAQFVWMGLACLLLIWLPGSLLLRILRLPRSTDWPMRSLIEIAVGLSLWPLVLLWSSVVADASGWNGWSTSSVRLVSAGVAAPAVFLIARNLALNWKTIVTRIRRQAVWLLLFAFLFLLAAATRIMHVRELVLPNWVDSVHHVMIVRLIVEHGLLPATYDPYIVNGAFSYHWGFHALVAWLAWLLNVDDAFELAQLVLVVGQTLGVVALWGLYGSGRLLFNSRRAGYMAAALGMFVSWYPAYYAGWGRYTHLEGLVLASAFLAALWRLGSVRRHTAVWAILACATGAGLALTHVRVAAFAAVFALLLFVGMMVRRMWRAAPRWAATGVGALILIGPWLIWLWSHPRTASLLYAAGGGALTWREAVERIPWGLVWIPGMREVTLLASGGLSELTRLKFPLRWLDISAVIWLLVLLGAGIWNAYAGRRGRRGRPFPWRGVCLLCAWSAVVFLIVNAQLAGLPRVVFLTVGAAAITLFAPVSLVAAGLLTWVQNVFIPKRWLVPVSVSMTVFVASWGAFAMHDIVNPSTVLAGPEDMAALQWIREQTPRDARFAVDVWRWQGVTYAGTDGGYWIPVLTDRTALTPPVLYSISGSRDAVAQVTQTLEEWAEVQTRSANEIAAFATEHDLDHIYVGSRAQHLNAAELAQSDSYELVYSRDGVHIFRLRDSTDTP